MVLVGGLFKKPGVSLRNSSMLFCRKGNNRHAPQTDYTVLAEGVHLSLRCVPIHSEVRGMAALERV